MSFALGHTLSLSLSLSASPPWRSSLAPVDATLRVLFGDRALTSNVDRKDWDRFQAALAVQGRDDVLPQSRTFALLMSKDDQNCKREAAIAWKACFPKVARPTVDGKYVMSTEQFMRMAMQKLERQRASVPWRIDAIAGREELIDLLWGIELGQQLPVGQCCDGQAAAVPPWRSPEVEASAEEEEDDAWGEWKGKQSSASLGSNLGGTMAREEVPDSDEDDTWGEWSGQQPQTAAIIREDASGSAKRQSPAAS